MNVEAHISLLSNSPHKTFFMYILGIQIRNSKMDLNIVELTKGAEIFTDHNALIRF